VTINTGACVTISRPNIATGWPERKPDLCYRLKMASGESLLRLKEALVKLTLGQSPMSISVFVAEITDDFILTLDVLHTYDAFMDLGSHTLRLSQEEVSLWSPLAIPRHSRLVVTSDQVILAQCEGVSIAQLESLLRAEDGPIKLSLEAHALEEIYIAETLVWD
jgi:hypothetical protein